MSPVLATAICVIAAALLILIFFLGTPGDRER